MHPNRLVRGLPAGPTNQPVRKLRINRLRIGNLAKQLMAVVLVAGLATELSGCRFARKDNQQAETATDENIDVASDIENTQTKVKITVPGGWVAVKDGQRRSTDIYAVSPADKLYAAVLSESQSVLSQFDLENNAEQYRWLIQKELDSFEKETRTGTTSIGGVPALQYEIRGQVDGTPVVYLHTTVKGVDNYYQVVGWTTADSYQKNKETLQDIIKSFRGT